MSNEFMVMRMLIDNPHGLYGSQFVNKSEGRLKRSGIYVLLERMVDKGYLTVTEDAPTEEYLTPRFRHKLSAEGRRVYEQFLRSNGLQALPGFFGRNAS